jgi:signal transduction histidine kinase
VDPVAKKRRRVTARAVEKDFFAMNRSIDEKTAQFLAKIDSVDYGGNSACFVLRKLLEAIQVILPYSYASVWLVNEAQEVGILKFPKTLSLVASAGSEIPDQFEGTYLDLQDSFSGQTILQNRIIRDNHLDGNSFFKHKKLFNIIKGSAGISVPLHSPKWLNDLELLGVLNLYFPNLPRISDEALYFIGYRLSNSIEILKIVHRDLITSQLLSYSSGYIETHFNHSISAMRNYGIEASSIFCFDGSRNKLCLVATTGIRDCNDMRLVKYELGKGLTGHVGKQQKHIIIHDMQAGEIKSVHAAAFLELPKEKIKSFIACPIINKSGDLIGVIRGVNKLLNGKRVASFSQMDLNIVTRIAEVLCQHMERVQLEKTRESLLAKIPHDLKAPIVAVRNNASNIKEYRKNPTFQFDRKLDDIIDDCNIMFLLLQQIKRDKVYKFEKNQLKPIIAKLVKELRPMARSFKIKELDYDDSIDHIPPDMYVDKIQMQHLFFNLIINAIKYSYAGTDIEIKARTISNYVGIDIVNWGIGVISQYKDLIFEPEIRTPEAIEVDVTGTGWGLSISQEIAIKHEGKIVLSSLSSPTVFTVYLPLYLAQRRPE